MHTDVCKYVYMYMSIIIILKFLHHSKITVMYVNAIINIINKEQ